MNSAVIDDPAAADVTRDGTGLTDRIQPAAGPA